MKKSRKSKYNHINHLNELSLENKLAAIRLNYLRLGSKIFQIFAEVAKRDRLSNGG